MKIDPYPPIPFQNALVVEDEEQMRDLIRAALQPYPTESRTFERDGETFVDNRPTSNFNVIEASSGEEAYELVTQEEASKRSIQVAFIDMRLTTTWDGLDTIQKLTEYDPRICYIIVTGIPDEARKRISRELGMVPFLIIPKPFEQQVLFDEGYKLAKRWCRLHA